MTSAHKNWSEHDDTGYCLSKDGRKRSTTTILAERGIELGISVP